MRKVFIKEMKGLLPHIMVMCLSGDLLYLYYGGYWYDPMQWIETLEVVVLYICAILALVICIRKVNVIGRYHSASIR